jgi:hypothetical protein
MLYLEGVTTLSFYSREFRRLDFLDQGTKRYFSTDIFFFFRALTGNKLIVKVTKCLALKEEVVAKSDLDPMPRDA